MAKIRRFHRRGWGRRRGFRKVRRVPFKRRSFRILSARRRRYYSRMKHLVSKLAETKWMEISSNLWNWTPAGFANAGLYSVFNWVAPWSNIAEGDTRSSRDGEVISCKNFHFQGLLECPFDDLADDYIETKVRVVVLIVKDAGLFDDHSDLYFFDEPFKSPVAYKNGVGRVLFDRVYTLNKYNVDKYIRFNVDAGSMIQKFTSGDANTIGEPYIAVGFCSNRHVDGEVPFFKTVDVPGSSGYPMCQVSWRDY